MTPQELDASLQRIALQEQTIKSTLMQRFLRKVGPTRAFAEVYRRLGPAIDPWLMRVSKGSVARDVYGFPALLLLSTGAKSGQKRTSPLMYARDGADFLVVGTNFGTENHPAWTANLRKTPEAEIVVGAEVVPVIAEQLDEPTFQAFWPRFTVLYPGYESYLARLTDRRPRMFRLRPVAR